MSVEPLAIGLMQHREAAQPVSFLRARVMPLDSFKVRCVRSPTSTRGMRFVGYQEQLISHSIFHKMRMRGVYS